MHLLSCHKSKYSTPKVITGSYIITLCSVFEFIWVFLAGYTSSCEWYDIDICSYMKNYKAVSTCHQTFVILKVLKHNKRTQCFMARTLYSVFVQGTVRVGYSPSLLLLWTLGIMHEGSLMLTTQVPQVHHLCIAYT